MERFISTNFKIAFDRQKVISLAPFLNPEVANLFNDYDYFEDNPPRPTNAYKAAYGRWFDFPFYDIRNKERITVNLNGPRVLKSAAEEEHYKNLPSNYSIKVSFQTRPEDWRSPTNSKKMTTKEESPENTIPVALPGGRNERKISRSRSVMGEITWVDKNINKKESNHKNKKKFPLL